MARNYVTIEDIAEMAGVGKGTVDRVLHNRGRVSEETRQRVLQCIKELDYKPNKAARMLAKKKTYRIAVIYHNKETEFWHQVEEGINKAEQEYCQLGIVIDRFILPQINLDEQLMIIEKVIVEKYDGIAIVPYYSERIVNALNKAVEQGIQVVTFNNDENCKRACYVGQDLKQSGRTAGQFVSMITPLNSDYIVVLPVVSRMSALHSRYEGFEEVIKERRPDLKNIGVYNFEQNGNEAYTKVLELVTTKSIDAIYVSNVILEDVARAVSDAKLKKHIILVGHDLTNSIVEYIKAGIIDISIGQEPHRQGYIATKRLCDYFLAGENINKDYYTKIEVVTSENVAYIENVT